MHWWTAAGYDNTESGWMDAKAFLHWFRTVFLPHVKYLEGPKLLLLDGHASHISLELMKLAKENNVILFKLPAHTSHLVQPLDVGVFKTSKAIWKKILHIHFASTGFKAVTKKTLG